MTTRIQVINNALQMLGVDEVTVIGTSNRFVIAAQNQYDFLLKGILGSENWRFATRFETLNRLVEEPGTAYFQYFYQLPADFLAVVRLEPNEDSYEIYSKGRLASNLSNLKLEYRYLIDEEFWPDYFADYFASALAVRLATTSVRNPEIAKMLTAVFYDAHARAIFIDNQNRPNSQLQYNPIISARY